MISFGNLYRRGGSRQDLDGRSMRIVVVIVMVAMRCGLRTVAVGRRRS